MSSRQPFWAEVDVGQGQAGVSGIYAALAILAPNVITELLLTSTCRITLVICAALSCQIVCGQQP